MANKVEVGMTTWDNDVKRPAFGQNNKDLYMRLENGTNVLRVITKPHVYNVHRYKANESDPGYGDRILCSAFHGSCPVCDKGDKAKRRWLVGIIDRKTSAYKILDISVSVYKAIQELVRDEDYGDPSMYDIDIKVDKQGGATGYYNVVPKPKKPLSPSDLQIKESVDLDDLKRRCVPPTPEKVLERLEALKAKTTVPTNGNRNVSSSDEEFPPV